MKPFHELTRLGIIRRLRQVAWKALQAYDLKVAKMEFLTIDTNTMFKVRSDQGERYVMRIYSEEETTPRENQAEMFWLNALIQDTDLHVVEPIPRRDGDFITPVQVMGVPGERRCALFKWIPGRPLEEHLSTENYCKLGMISAKLHNHAASLPTLPQEIQPKKWDRVFYYPDEPVVYDKPGYHHLFPYKRLSLLNRVIEKSQTLFSRLFSEQGDPILIHGDLHFWNVHVHHGELYIIDFEDISLGYPIQDIAVTLYYGRDRKDYPSLVKALKRGYTGIRPWPDESQETIETLMAARAVNFINYVARVDNSPGDFIKRKCRDLEAYLEQYP